MTSIRIQKAASLRIDEIYRYSRDKWGTGRADAYIVGLFEVFAAIEAGSILSRPIPAAFGVDGYFCRHERHYVYWKRLSDGNMGIVTILHERMHQIDRFQEDFGDEFSRDPP